MKPRSMRSFHHQAQRPDATQGPHTAMASRPPQDNRFSVRAGPSLADNLRRYAEGDKPRPYAPPRRTLNLLSCGGREAIATWGPWVASGRWAWWWKDRIDRGFVADFTRAA